MVLFWISAGLLTVVTVLVVTRPLTRSSAGADRATSAIGGPAHAESDIAVYKQQLLEVDGDLARGLISPAEAEAARVEIARRLLDKAGPGASLEGRETATQFEPSRDASGGRSLQIQQRVFAGLAAAIPAVALGLYIAQGSPGLPGMPASERMAQQATAQSDIEELVARVEARLRTNPSDGMGWEVIGPVYLRMERFRDATEAFKRSIEILGENAKRLSGLAESLVLSNDGIVSEEARIAYKKILALDPQSVEAKFGLALAMEQDGDIDGAVKSYEGILETAPPRAPWRTYVAERLEAIELKRNGATAAGSGAAKSAGGAEAQIAALPDAERRQVILQMVEGLEQRLKVNGNDAEGWQRLIRSWAVLGERAKAEAALADARKALAEDNKALGEINVLARTLGLKS